MGRYLEADFKIVGNPLVTSIKRSPIRRNERFDFIILAIGF